MSLTAPAALHISAQVMQWVYTSSSDKPSAARSVKPQVHSGFFSSLFTNFVGSVTPPPEEPKTVIDPRQIRVTSVALSIFSADVDVRLDKKLSAELHRSTKKNPPSKLKYELIYVSAYKIIFCIETDCHVRLERMNTMLASNRMQRMRNLSFKACALILMGMWQSQYYEKYRDLKASIFSTGSARIFIVRRI